MSGSIGYIMLAFAIYLSGMIIIGALYAKEGVRLWFRTKRPAYRQLCLKLTA